MTSDMKDTELRQELADVLMTPNQAWRGMKKIPIELIWGLEQLIKRETDKARKEGEYGGVNWAFENRGDYTKLTKKFEEITNYYADKGAKLAKKAYALIDQYKRKRLTSIMKG